MNRNSRLAIIIPAYKGLYLEKTLQSFADQTCKDFTLYIGDDQSPDELYEIVKQFENQIHIEYKKFENNLGGVNLVNQWNRCLEIIKSEDWIWLFSDDDYVDKICVESFYKNLSIPIKTNIYRFNLQIVDQDNEEMGGLNRFPENLSAEEFFEGRIKKNIYSYAVEYIFNRKAFEDVGGFEYFDLCWSTDDATWIKLARKNGIATINEGIVYWRYSGINISSIKNDKSIVLRKLQANLDFLIWSDNFLQRNNMIVKVSPLDKIKWLLTMPIGTTSLSFSEKIHYLKMSLKKLNMQNLRFAGTLLIYYGLFKKYIKSTTLSRQFLKTSN